MIIGLLVGVHYCRKFNSDDELCASGCSVLSISDSEWASVVWKIERLLFFVHFSHSADFIRQNSFNIDELKR